MRTTTLTLVGLWIGAGCSEPEGTTCTTDTECAADASPDTGIVGSDTGTTTGGGDAGMACAPTETSEMTCNGLDDDCNGRIDDVDLGMDGFCDCLTIGVIGKPGTQGSSNFQAWLKARGTTVTRIGLDDAPLTSETLMPFDVVVLDLLQRDYTNAEAEVLREFVDTGGSVMSMNGYVEENHPSLGRSNQLLAAIGLAYVSGLLDGPVTQWETHPLTTGITSVSFLGGYVIEAVAGVTGGTNTVIGKLPEGTVGIAQERGMGRVFVWGDEWIQYDSEWSAMPEIAQFWTNVFSWLGPRNRCSILI